MIINHQYQFCFFAVPRTASTAISEVLKEKYGGLRILKRHNSYQEFIDQAEDHEKGYFKFASVRNPMDSVVSAYFKKKADHNGRFSRGTYHDGRPIGKQSMEEYTFITTENASFQDYFIKFYTEPYERKRHEHTIEQMDAIIRFEYLNEDFKKVMKQLNLPFYPIPVINSTSNRSRDFLQFYSPEIRERAIQVFSPIMKKWGYTFPADW